MSQPAVHPQTPVTKPRRCRPGSRGNSPNGSCVVDPRVPLRNSRTHRRGSGWRLAVKPLGRSLRRSQLAFCGWFNEAKPHLGMHFELQYPCRSLVAPTQDHDTPSGASQSSDRARFVIRPLGSPRLRYIIKTIPISGLSSCAGTVKGLRQSWGAGDASFVSLDGGSWPALHWYCPRALWHRAGLRP